MQPLDLALFYAAKGWPVFPCRHKEFYDEDGEIFGEKTPLIGNGFKGATKTPRIIKRWWSDHPEALVGVATGTGLDAWVLDLDIKPGVGDGHDWLAARVKEHGPLPATAIAKSANGGTHYYWKHHDGVRNRGRLGTCVDTRGEGGYVIAPGSVMGDGRSYVWIEDRPIADAPDWLLALVLPQPEIERPGQSSHFTHQSSAENEPYVRAAVDAELAVLAGATQGGRGEALNRSAFTLGTLVGAGALARSEAETGLYAAAAANGVLAKDGERSTRSKIKRGLDAGQRSPRAIPQLQGDDTPLVDFRPMLRGKHSHGGSNTLPPATAEVLEQAVPEPPPAIYATPYLFKDPRTLKRREFVYGSHYIRKYVSVTVSPGGLGKTSNSIVEALSMASGRPLVGDEKPTERMRVWLFNAEDPRDELERRIQAACIHYKLGPEDINGYLFLDTGREQDLVVAIDDKRGTKIQMPVIMAVIDQIKRNNIDIMIVDPFVSTHNVNENDNGAVDRVAKLWGQIADDTNCSIDIVHHLRKIADREATVDDARGAVSLIGAARSVRVLNRMSEEQATASGISEADRYGYFNIHQGKANLTKTTGGLSWRRLESVSLGNGSVSRGARLGPQRPSDHIGVVTEWRWPSAEELVGEVTLDQLAAIKQRIAMTDCKLHPAAQNWVGVDVAYALGVDVTIKANRTKVTRMIKAWIDDGTLIVVNRRCPVKRENKDFVEVAIPS